MKSKIITFIVLQIIVLLISISSLYAWTGDTWGPISRETIVRIADEMVDFSWSPKKTINNWDYGSVWKTFNAGTIYWGEAYSQNNPQENWTEFYSIVNSTTGGNTYYGNDCSGFVSMSWKLKKRYTTSDFECDAMNTPSPCGNYYSSSTDDFVTKLGDIGAAQSVNLLKGDALVSTTKGHMILFESYLPDGTGINAMEQTPLPPSYSARRSQWTWTKLASYRPIRRNNIDEGNYLFQTKWGSYGSGDGQFYYPWRVAVDSSGNVYVADTDNNRIQKFDSNGNFITKWGSYGTGDGQFKYPAGIAVDPSGNVYAADSGNDRIQKFDGNGGFITKWGSFGNGDGQFSMPIHIAVDSSGNVYVADTDNDRIQKFDGNGGFITKWGSFGNGDGQFNAPYGIAVDLFGNANVADTGNNRIQKFNNNGGFITKWGSFGTGDGQFYYPYGLAVDSTGNVFVADTENYRIQKFNSNGGFITKWGSFGIGDGEFGGGPMGGVTVDLSGNVYVADTYNNRIQKFSPVSPLPYVPSALTATVVSPTQINLLWQDSSNNETGFKIMRKIGVNGTYSTIATVGVNIVNYSDSTVSGGNIYYYAVWAYNGYGDSAYSNEASAAISTGGVPTSPSNLKTTPISSTRITLTWADNSDNETGFYIERKIATSGIYSEMTLSGDGYVQIATVVANVTSYTDTEVFPDTTYYYRITAYNAGGETYSNEINATTFPDDADDDNDGLTDDEEGVLGTDPNNPDTDGDGYSDYSEVQAGSDPLDENSKPQLLGDINKDGIIDISDVILVLRIALSLDPLKPCSDINNDGVVDISDVILTLRMALELDSLQQCTG